MKLLFLSVASVIAVASSALAVDRSGPAMQSVTRSCWYPCPVGPIGRSR